MKQFLTIISLVGALLLMVSAVEACEHQDVKECTFGHENGHQHAHKGGHVAGPYFITPKNGATVSGTVKIKMGVHGMKVYKAGDVIEGTGHHHLIIDGTYISETQGVPKDATHIHFGKGQTETEIKLSKGKHTLTLQFADGHHQSYGKVFSRTIQVIVE